MSRSRALRSAPCLAVSASLLLLGGCAAGPTEPTDEDLAAIESADVALVGTDDLTWDRTDVEADAGTITFALTCEQAVNHDLVVDGEDVATCRPGETSTGELDLQPGTYGYVCTVPGHERTMQGTLTVT